MFHSVRLLSAVLLTQAPSAVTEQSSELDQPRWGRTQNPTGALEE